MNSSCYLISFYVLFSAACLAQPHSNPFIIKGKVVELESGAPVLSAAVFLENTTIGTTTDPNGEFELKSSKYGTYNLIVSSLGFDLQSVPVRAYKAELFELTIKLRQKSIVLNEIRIEAKFPDDWEEHIKLFREEFLGKTINSENTKLVNPEVINFRLDENSGTLYAYTDSTIVINNMALGYRLKVILDSFSFNKKDILRYFYHCQFEELAPEDDEQKTLWEANRKDCYLGSPKHFFSSLINKSVSSEFILYTKDPKLVAITQWHRISPDDLLLSYDKENEQYFFKTDKVFKVECFNNSKVSYIGPLGSKISTDLYGNSNNLFILDGYWKELRMADQLPFDYVYTP
ncbi:MAG: carboxypeptidase-like regulatory domain-containing protein [Ignavibacteria bacterium]|nr:carboxypeptidase-like regulatory domain-containing protein [Ignavibacteria bacterium]MCU7517046.1 carboxypeptidase-like regulatory domain-containing protein [Ignavibacteria bacterium]